MQAPHDLGRGALKAQIKEMWEAGSSGGQIAKYLGVTRNVVIGHVSRMNLVTRGVKTRTFTARPTRPRSAPVAPPAAPTDAPPPLNLSIEDLSNTVCRFPLGDGPFTFCGHAVQGRGPYCEFHHERCFDHKHQARA